MSSLSSAFLQQQCFSAASPRCLCLLPFYSRAHGQPPCSDGRGPFGSLQALKGFLSDKLHRLPLTSLVKQVRASPPRLNRDGCHDLLGRLGIRHKGLSDAIYNFFGHGGRKDIDAREVAIALSTVCSAASRRGGAGELDFAFALVDMDANDALDETELLGFFEMYRRPITSLIDRCGKNTCPLVSSRCLFVCLCFHACRLPSLAVVPRLPSLTEERPLFPPHPAISSMGAFYATCGYKVSEALSFAVLPRRVLCLRQCLSLPSVYATCGYKAEMKAVVEELAAQTFDDHVSCKALPFCCASTDFLPKTVPLCGVLLCHRSS
eukprot:SAG22_NODE_388_length_11295_cov_14.512594_14_plen_321_part_00